MLVLRNQLPVRLPLALLVTRHALLVEHSLALLPDLADPLHRLERLLHELAIVSHGHVAPCREGERAVDDHLLACRFTECLCPLELAWVPLHLELWEVDVSSCQGKKRPDNLYVLMAFAAAESKCPCIVANESDTFARVTGLRTEIARFDAHLGGVLEMCFSFLSSINFHWVQNFAVRSLSH